MTPERLTGEALDPVLEPFLGAPLESVEEHDALHILIDQVTPVIEGVVRGRAAASVAAVEREELFSEAVLQLIRKLQELKADPGRPPIGNFHGYAAVTTFNVVHAHFRRVHPERQRLRNHIRHVVRKSSRFALWQLQSGRFVCGLAGWPETTSGECSEADLDRVPQLSPPVSVNWNDAIGRAQIARAIEHVFEHARKPVELERLVEKVAELFRLPMAPSPAVQSERVDEAVSVEASLVYRSALVEVWREIGLLPPRQRVALLLGLRDENGSAITSLLILLRIVTFDELAAIWDQLPLPDMVIAERLVLTRQQIINLRKSARQRLGRRLPFLRDGNPLLDRASS